MRLMIQLINFRSAKGSAWVQSSTTLGELYYEISKKSGTLAFPAGTCPTVCVGGHFSGGGLGTLVRKYSLSADNILDAKLIDFNGRILDKESMGENRFWAIRGGGGGSFGILLAWKLSLIQVPKTVTVFTINKTLDRGAVGLVHKWQYIAHKMSKDIFLKVDIVPKMNGSDSGSVFKSLFLGMCTDLLNYMQKHFPELGVKRSDCREMSWIQSVVYFAGFGDSDPHEILLNRGLQPKVFNKGTSDYVTDPIPLRIFL
ncbi:hypothetical protein LUZ60_012469 [Juncus effusus]|nr:hypothetical protein LUZ60_012469 [Juncus effusus]